MIVSDYDGIIEYENINDSPIGTGRWITKHSIEWGKNKYILQWRKSNQEPYKYFFTKYPEDKKWLIETAERY